MSVSKEMVEAYCLGALLRWMRQQQTEIHGRHHRIEIDEHPRGEVERVPELTSGRRAGVVIITETELEWFKDKDPTSSHYDEEFVLIKVRYIKPGHSTIGKAGIKSYIPEKMEDVFEAGVVPV